MGDIGHTVSSGREADALIKALLRDVDQLLCFGAAGRGPRLLKGMTLAIEPMVNAGVADVHILKDGWTVKTNDGRLSAHYENTVLITDGEPEILTVTEGL